VLSPVLTINGVTIQATSTSTQKPAANNAANQNGAQITFTNGTAVLAVNGNSVELENGSFRGNGARNATLFNLAAGQIAMDAGEIPAITFIVKNTNATETEIAFGASIDTQSRAGRSMSAPQSKWKESFDLVLQPGETREIQIEPRVNVNTGIRATLSLTPADQPKSAITALAFSVPSRPSQARVNSAAATPAVPGIDPAKPVKFVTQPSTGTPAITGQSSVQAAVLAGLKASMGNADQSPEPTPATRVERPVVSPAVAPTPKGLTPIQATVIAGLKASMRETPAAAPAPNTVAIAETKLP
jgi:hypothetical protein